MLSLVGFIFFFKQKTAYEMRISDWSSDVCSSDLAKKLLPRFLALLQQFAHSPAKALAATLTSWLEPIVGMWRFSKSNGITEGFHTKMEMLSRRAFVFRNFENYRMRVLAQCGWNGVIDRV